MSALVLSLIKQQALIFALIAVFGGTEGGRLTDWTCWALIASLASFTVFVGRVDRAVARGRVDQRSLPRWLRDD